MGSFSCPFSNFYFLLGRRPGAPPSVGICEKTRWHRHSCLCAFAKSNKFSFGEVTYRCQIAPFWVFSQLLCEGGILRQRPCGGSLGGGSFSSHVTDKNRNRLLRGAGVHLLASDQGRSYGSNYLGQITAQRLDANIGESIFEGFARKSWNGTRPPALDAAPSSSAAG